DVSWTDPDRELVGEHRAKKRLAREKQQAEKQQVEEQGGTAKPIRTAGYVSASSTERTFAFLGSKSLRKVLAPLKPRPSSSASPVLAQPKASQQPCPPTSQYSAKRDSRASGPPADFLGNRQQLRGRARDRSSRKEDVS